MGCIRFGLLAGWLVGVVGSVAAQTAATAIPDLEPYVAYIAQDECFARSGPGPDYYRTDPMPRGAPVDVYLETSDGWLGIRPPEGSFSWLPASQTRPTPEGDFAEVTNPQAVAWIGTQLGKARQFRWQVQLQPGERLAVLERFQRPGTNGATEQWLKIVPPAGEFRWVHKDSVALSRDVAMEGAGAPVESLSVEPIPAEEAPRVSRAAPPPRESERSDVARVSYEAPAEEPVAEGDPEEQLPDESDDPASRLQRCQTQLTALLAQEATANEVQWLLDQITDGMRAEPDSVQRARWQLMYERTQQYLTLCQRRERTAAADQPEGPYDRTGILKQVYSARPSAPPYALVDRTGNTLIYVTPSPGLNLRRFLDQEIGVTGSVSFSTGLDTPLIVAARVTRLR
jgi:SH3-like domain-containing protein